jgi:hypothetical protein
MAIPNLDEYKLALSNQREILPITAGTTTLVLGRPYDLWRTAVPVGLAPTTPEVPTNDTLGALGQRNPASGQLNIIGARFNSLNPGNYIIADRLSHTGGLDGSISDEQVTNLPTATLTRYTNGEGVMIGLTIYGAIGGTATTVTARYTNQAGVGNQQTPLVAMGGTGFNAANRMILLPLQEGDTGVRSVEGVQLTAPTGGIGNFGVTLFKPLYVICSDESSGVVSAAGFITGRTCGGVPVVPNNACLFPIVISTSTNAFGAGALLLDEN